MTREDIILKAVNAHAEHLARELFDTKFKLEFALDIAIETMNHARTHFVVDDYFLDNLKFIEQKRNECK